MKANKLTAFCALMVAAIALWGCREAPASGADKQSAPPPLVVAVATPQEQTLVRIAEAQGALFPKERAVVASEVPGTVAQVLADFGDSVIAGQPLLRIDSREYQLRADSSRAALSQAQARLLNAQAEFNRVEQLRDENMVSQAQFDQTKAALGVSEADAEAAEKALRLAEKKLGDTTIRAPFASSVQKRLVSAGEYINVGQQLYELIATDPIKLRTELPERFVPMVKVGLEVRLTVDAARDRSYTGTITRIAPALDDATRTLLVEAEVPNKDGSLRPGYFAHVKVSLGKDRGLFVPQNAVIRYAGVERVFVVQDGVARSREVATGAVVGDRIEITRGVAKGEKVIVTDVDRLSDGIVVAARGAS